MTAPPPPRPSEGSAAEGRKAGAGFIAGACVCAGEWRGRRLGLGLVWEGKWDKQDRPVFLLASWFCWEISVRFFFFSKIAEFALVFDVFCGGAPFRASGKSDLKSERRTPRFGRFRHVVIYDIIRFQFCSEFSGCAIYADVTATCLDLLDSIQRP